MRAALVPLVPLGLVFVLASGDAYADPPAVDPAAEAKRHLDAATAAFKAHRYADALKELKLAYSFDQQPELLYAIGQVHVNLGQCEEAITFYSRFIQANHDPDKATMAQQAIDTCKQLLADRPQRPPTPPPPQQPPQPQPQQPELPPEDEPPLWYTDWLTDGLVGLGAVAGGSAIAVITSARRDRDRADSRRDYDAYTTLVEHARTKQRVAIVLGASSVALIGGGVIRFLLHRDSETLVLAPPARGTGAIVTWNTRF